MSVRVQRDKYGRSNVVCDRRWPDGKRFRKIMPNKTVAKKIDLRIASAIAVGTWRELREELLYGTRSDYSVTEYADHYLEVYCKVHNKDWKRKQSSLKHVKRLLGKVLLQERKLLCQFVKTGNRIFTFVVIRNYRIQSAVAIKVIDIQSKGMGRCYV